MHALDRDGADSLLDTPLVFESACEARYCLRLGDEVRGSRSAADTVREKSTSQDDVVG